MNFFLKIVIYAAVIHGVHLLVDGLHYSTLLAPVGLVFLFATVGHVADQWILPRWGNLLSTIAGSSFMVTVIWGAQFLFPGSLVRFPVALVTGAVLGAVEYRMHMDILKARNA
ncbi:uncharacterized protein DUF2512 [Melghirimyces profundicolus]|uniref:Uncharacterized protein DUF2512 n=1 Tax=Melghirimyces profundicolus TaxID=1242148 RepID=A0A2T6BXM4_9BACL|nr:hypothetical protein [Melghirimyces profundicolus]PTX60829.1 uncharacterized protein DUF2512 [Melghirimyces profundicolus]